MTRTPFTLAFCALLAGCVVPTDAPETPAEAPEPRAVTSIELANTVPDDGASHVYPADPFTLWFSEEPDGVAVAIDGVDAVIEEGNQRWFFRAGQELAPETDYIAEITWSEEGFLDGSATLSFTTSGHGEPILDASAVAGGTWVLALTSGQLLSPPGLQAIYHLIIPEQAFVFGVAGDSDVDGGELRMHSGVINNLDNPQTQYLCQETASWSAGPDGVVGTDDDRTAAFTDPSFDFGPANVTPPRSGWPFGFHSLRLSGTFDPNGDVVAGISYSGIFDSRAIDWPGEENYCDLLSRTVGVDCVDCPDDGEDIACLEFEGVDMKAYRVDVTLEEVTCADILDRVEDGTCPDTVAGFYDADGDGVYEGCPAWGG